MMKHWQKSCLSVTEIPTGRKMRKTTKKAIVKLFVFYANAIKL